MNRRRFLRESVAGGTLAVAAGGFLFVRRSSARSALTSRLLDEALPPLTANSSKELNGLPARARNELKRYFLGRCLNVEGFVSLICSKEFAERLGRCPTPDAREACFLQSFCSHVAPAAEIMNEVDTIAAELGAELDAAWSVYCHETIGKWNARMLSYGPRLAMDEFTDQLDGYIRADLARAARQGVSEIQRPAVGETIGKIGESAVLLLPVVEYGALGLQVGIPLFFLLAAKHVWDYAMAQFEDRRGDYQSAISGRLALLGNRVGAEFEREVRLRISDLHTWRERSIRENAARLAEERVTLI
jgi:hypothetical protein